MYHAHQMTTFIKQHEKEYTISRANVCRSSVTVQICLEKGAEHAARENYSSGMHVTISSGNRVFSFRRLLHFFFARIRFFCCNSIQNKQMPKL